MENHKSVRICITLSPRLLRQLDAIVHDSYTSRSNAIRLALLHWIKSEAKLLRVAAGAAVQMSEDKPVGVESLLSSDQLKVLRKMQKGRATTGDLINAGITPKMQIELMTLGEM